MMRLYKSLSSDAAVNAGHEEWLLRTLPPEASGMLLYVNGPSVLIGRNQNPWSECDTSFCRSAGIGLVRRISGGGAVYHDGGNLNVSLIVPRGEYSPEGFARFLQSCLEECGLLSLTADEHNSLYEEGLKVCGTASAVCGGHALHHGCILVSTDLEMLRRVLQVPASRRVRGVSAPSRRAAVTRLADHVDEAILPKNLAEYVRVLAKEAYGKIEEEVVVHNEMEGGGAYVFRFKSSDWTYGRSGRFWLEESLPAGVLSGESCLLSCEVSDGVLVSARVDGAAAPDLVGRELKDLV